jgi:hypothetical protein
VFFTCRPFKCSLVFVPLCVPGNRVFEEFVLPALEKPTSLQKTSRTEEVRLILENQWRSLHDLFRRVCWLQVFVHLVDRCLLPPGAKSFKQWKQNSGPVSFLPGRAISVSLGWLACR